MSFLAAAKRVEERLGIADKSGPDAFPWLERSEWDERTERHRLAEIFSRASRFLPSGCSAWAAQNWPAYQDRLDEAYDRIDRAFRHRDPSESYAGLRQFWDVIEECGERYRDRDEGAGDRERTG